MGSVGVYQNILEFEKVQLEHGEVANADDANLTVGNWFFIYLKSATYSTPSDPNSMVLYTSGYQYSELRRRRRLS